MNLIKHSEDKISNYTNMFNNTNCDSKKSQIIQDILLTQNRIIDHILKLEKTIEDNSYVIKNIR